MPLDDRDSITRAEIELSRYFSPSADYSGLPIEQKLDFWRYLRTAFGPKIPEINLDPVEGLPPPIPTITPSSLVRKFETDTDDEAYELNRKLMWRIDTGPEFEVVHQICDRLADLPTREQVAVYKIMLRALPEDVAQTRDTSFYTNLMYNLISNADFLTFEIGITPSGHAFIHEKEPTL